MITVEKFIDVLERAIEEAVPGEGKNVTTAVKLEGSIMKHVCINNPKYFTISDGVIDVYLKEAKHD